VTVRDDKKMGKMELEGTESGGEKKEV